MKWDAVAGGYQGGGIYPVLCGDAKHVISCAVLPHHPYVPKRWLHTASVVVPNIRADYLLNCEELSYLGVCPADTNFITIGIGMVRLIRCKILNAKANIINCSEISRLSLAIHHLFWPL